MSIAAPRPMPTIAAASWMWAAVSPTSMRAAASARRRRRKAEYRRQLDEETKRPALLDEEGAGLFIVWGAGPGVIVTFLRPVTPRPRAAGATSRARSPAGA